MPEAIVLSGSGYAGAEVLRLLAGHPHLDVVAATGHTTAGTPVASLHPHLRSYAGLELVSLDEVAPLLQGDGPLAIFGCGAHGASAADTARALAIASELGRPATFVDLSADFRHDAEAFEAIYGVRHPAPELLDDVTCGLPDLDPSTPTHACQPGCFTTAVVLGTAPLVAAGVVEPAIRVSAVTGSTGSGRNPKPGTHHPRRHGNLWGYSPLAHRHVPEMERLTGATVAFAPHSGPFARGIAATSFLTRTRPGAKDALIAAYADSPFVTVVDRPPELASVVGTNRCHLSVTERGDDIVVHSVIDNLIKGAAGGAVQWMNRLLGWPDETGLLADPLPWT